MPGKNNHTNQTVIAIMIECDSYCPPLPVWTVGKIYLIVEHFKHLRRFTPMQPWIFDVLCHCSSQLSRLSVISSAVINISIHFEHTDWMGGGLEHPEALFILLTERTYDK